MRFCLDGREGNRLILIIDVFMFRDDRISAIQGFKDNQGLSAHASRIKREFHKCCAFTCSRGEYG